MQVNLQRRLTSQQDDVSSSSCSSLAGNETVEEDPLLKTPTFSSATVCKVASRYCTPGLGDLFTITGHMNCALSLAGRKIKWFYPKIVPVS